MESAAFCAAESGAWFDAFRSSVNSSSRRICGSLGNGKREAIAFEAILRTIEQLWLHNQRYCILGRIKLVFVILGAIPLPYLVGVPLSSRPISLVKNDVIEWHCGSRVLDSILRDVV